MIIVVHVVPMIGLVTKIINFIVVEDFIMVEDIIVVKDEDGEEATTS